MGGQREVLMGESVEGKPRGLMEGAYFPIEIGEARRDDEEGEDEAYAEGEEFGGGFGLRFFGGGRGVRGYFLSKRGGGQEELELLFAEGEDVAVFEGELLIGLAVDEDGVLGVKGEVPVVVFVAFDAAMEGCDGVMVEDELVDLGAAQGEFVSGAEEFAAAQVEVKGDEARGLVFRQFDEFRQAYGRAFNGGQVEGFSWGRGGAFLRGRGQVQGIDGGDGGDDVGDREGSDVMDIFVELCALDRGWRRGSFRGVFEFVIGVEVGLGIFFREEGGEGDNVVVGVPKGRGGEGRGRREGGHGPIEDNVIVADDDGIALMDDGLALDALSIDEDAVVASQVFDEDLSAVAEQAGVVSRDIALGQLDGIAFSAADGNFVTLKGDEFFSTFVVLDKELQHETNLGC